MRSYSRAHDHVGEWKLTLWSDTVEGLFIEAARVIGRECGPPAGDPGGWEPIALSARDTATLLVDWCNELLGRSEVEGRAYGEVRAIRVDAEAEPGPLGRSPPDRACVDGSPPDGARVDAEIRGTPVRSWRSALKAATYHALELERQGRRYRAILLFDV